METPAEWLDIWPVFGIRVRTPRIEMRPVDPALAFELAELAAQGIHDPATMPFSIAWTDVEPPQQQRNTVKHFWTNLGAWEPDAWNLAFAVYDGTVGEGELVGIQAVITHDFAKLRGFESGSWIRQAFQGRGIGKEMRAASLHFMFAGLDAQYAFTGAWDDNAASLAVTRSLGYADNGVMIALRRDQPDRQQLFTMDRAHWESIRRDDIEITGLTEAALGMFGA